MKKKQKYEIQRVMHFATVLVVVVIVFFFPIECSRRSLYNFTPVLSKKNKTGDENTNQNCNPALVHE
jgi:hypothetical protein